MDNETKEMLNLILQKVTGVEQDVSGLKEDVSELKQDVSELKQDVSGLKEDVSELKQDVSGLKDEVFVLKEDVSILKQDMTEVKTLAAQTAIRLENVIEPKIQIVYENQVAIIDQSKRLKFQDSRIENLENDVSILKFAFKALKQG